MGTFAAQELSTALLRAESSKGIRARLANFPRDLEDVYSHILDKIGDRDKAEAALVLELISRANERVDITKFLAAMIGMEKNGRIRRSTYSGIEERSVKTRLHTVVGQLVQFQTAFNETLTVPGPNPVCETC